MSYIEISGMIINLILIGVLILKHRYDKIFSEAFESRLAEHTVKHYMLNQAAITELQRELGEVKEENADLLEMVVKAEANISTKHTDNMVVLNSLTDKIDTLEKLVGDKPSGTKDHLKETASTIYKMTNRNRGYIDAIFEDISEIKKALGKDFSGTKARACMKLLKTDIAILKKDSELVSDSFTSMTTSIGNMQTEDTKLWKYIKDVHNELYTLNTTAKHHKDRLDGCADQFLGIENKIIEFDNNHKKLSESVVELYTQITNNKVEIAPLQNLLLSLHELQDLQTKTQGINVMFNPEHLEQVKSTQAAIDQLLIHIKHQVRSKQSNNYIEPDMAIPAPPVLDKELEKKPLSELTEMVKDLPNINSFGNKLQSSKPSGII